MRCENRRPLFCSSAFIAAAGILEDCKLSVGNLMPASVDEDVEFLTIFVGTCFFNFERTIKERCKSFSRYKSEMPCNTTCNKILQNGAKRHVAQIDQKVPAGNSNRPKGCQH